MSDEKSDTKDRARDAGENETSASEHEVDEMAGPGARAGASGSSKGGAGASGAAAGSGSDAGIAQTDEGRGVNPDGTFHCDDRDELVATTTLSSDILQADPTFRGVVRVQGSIDATGGGTITVEPGTTFVMESGSRINFTFSGNTTVKFMGTATRPVRFCGAKAEAGFWRGLHMGTAAAFDGLTADSSLEHVLVADAGGDGATALAVTKQAKLVDVQIINSGGDGLKAADFASGSARLRIDGAKGVALVLTDPSKLDHVPTDGEFTNNAHNVAALPFDSIYDDTNVVFHDIGLPYLQQQNIDVGAATLVFEAGVEYRLASGVTLNVGSSVAAAKLQAQGTEAKPVVFRGEEDKPAYWNAINVYNVLPASTLEHVRIRQGGANGKSALLLNASITLKDVSVEDCGGPIAINAAPSADSTKLSVSGSAGAPLTTSFTVVPALPTGGKFEDNKEPAIQVGGDYQHPSGTIPNLGVPYALTTSLSLEAGTNVAVAAGTEFIASSDVGILVGWNGERATFKAMGTESQPIIFRGAEDSVGYWKGITFASNVTSDSALDHVAIKNAGVKLNRALSITNSSFSKSAGYGITKQASDTTDYTSTNTFTDNASGPVNM